MHAPAPMPPVAPIAPPPRIIRVGDMSMPAPDWVPDGPMHQINGTFAGAEAQMSTFARSVGIAPSRADALAAYETNTGTKMLLIGCALFGVPGAVVGSIIPVVGTVLLGAAGCAAGAGFVALIAAPTIALTFAAIGSGIATLPDGPIHHYISQPIPITQ